ncbi:MAG: diacylglycerol kinase family lipid kinase [Anaerolineae bacterium]|jgi:diacylglycerol kinase (ATP)|nr:diacylglycerol kinase family lipid kinase [Anaerolineae bacterium]MBT7072170.1 diacylglycerol kinase family lipid kinase [Anaerolineae bacterium]MBT7324290.1 diacylglycerol kinase family lipid kinase [Anaerolineae bacterium]
MRTAQIIYNPAAGRFPVAPAIPSAEHALRDAGWEVSSASTRSGEDGTYLAKRAAEKGINAVFAVGGDGTIGQIASGLVGTETALGILPAGTANVWGKELGMQPYSLLANNALEENAKKLANAPIYAVDIGICNQQPFLMWAGLGLDALSVQKVEPRFRLEKFFTMPEYATSILLTAARWRGISLKIWADGEEIEGHYILAVINNIRHYMGGMTNLSPDAMLDDGLFDLWLFTGNNMADALRPVIEMWGGRHIDSAYTRRIPFRELRLEAETPFAVQTDGEPRFDTKIAEISVRKRALRVLMPSNALDALSQEPIG